MSNLEIPESWAEAKLGDLALDTLIGLVRSAEEQRDTYPYSYLRMGDYNERGEVSFNSVVKVRATADELKRYELRENDFIFNTRNSEKLVGKVALIDGSKPPNLIFNNNLMRIRFKEISPSFIFWQFQSGFIRNQLELFKSGTTSVAAIYARDLVQTKLLIPPLGEQKRIVAKIESTQEKIKTIEQSVTKAEELISKYREALLQKAFRGELVPQDPKDEPASKVLERIRADRANQTDSKKKKKDDLPPIKPEEIPFEIPKSWEWVRLGSIASQIQYGYTASSERSGSHRFLRITDITKDGVDWESVPFCSPSSSDAAALNLKNGDIVFARTGGTVGKSHLIQSAPSNAIFASYLIKVRPENGAVNHEYLNLYFSSPTYWEFVTDNQRGAAQPNINGTTLGNLLIPLPPMAEQRRTVEMLIAKMHQVSFITGQILALSNIQRKLSLGILNSAFVGELVPQDPAEGTGHELLEKIKESTSADLQPLSSHPSGKTKAKKKTRTKK